MNQKLDLSWCAVCSLKKKQKNNKHIYNNSSSGPLPEAWELQGPVQHPTGAARYIWPFSALCQSLIRNGVPIAVPISTFLSKYREMLG